MVRAVVGFVLVLAVSGCGAHSRTTRASPLGVVSAATPRVRLAHVGTSGTYPQVRSGTRALGAVNAALRGAIVADQRAFELRVRRRRAWYETELDRTLVSASTVVVSVLIPRMGAAAPLRAHDMGWLGITIRVPSGKRVSLPDLFAKHAEATRVLEATIRDDTGLDPAVRRHPAASLVDAQFALLPTGLGVGVVEIGWRDVVVVPYSALRPYLSSLGTRLVAGLRWPDYRPDRKHFSYCRRPDNSGAELSATGDVPCWIARKVEAGVFSQRCFKRNRCVALGFTCLAFWDGRYDRPFDYTHHAICNDGRRRIIMDEG